jgi:hypothetical protein
VLFAEELHAGGDILLKYFHYCNNGSHLFKIDRTIDKNIDLAALSPGQVEFIKQSTGLIKLGV